MASMNYFLIKLLNKTTRLYEKSNTLRRLYILYTNQKSLPIFDWNVKIIPVNSKALVLVVLTSKGNNKITELRTILQRESQNS